MEKLTSKIGAIKTLGLVASPNIAAFDIEQVLGIKYSLVPTAYELTPRNVAVLSVHTALPPYGIDTYAYTKMIFSKQFDGIYIAPIHSYFFRKTYSLTGLHENIHGYINLKNQQIGSYLRDSLNASFSHVFGLKDQFIGAEKALAYKCLDEGLAEWGSIITGMKNEGTVRLDAGRRFSNLTSDRKINGKYPLDMTYEVLDDSCAYYDQSFRVGWLKDIAKIENKRKYNNHFVNNAITLAGFNFVHRGMNHLYSKGLSVPEAFDFLITHPPEDFSRMKNTEDYLNEVF